MRNSYTPDVISKVWQMATVVPGADPVHLRMDRCGALIAFRDYGNRTSSFGWELDHIIPLSKGGTDTWNNVQPLHWENNCSKGDGPLLCTFTVNNQC